LDANQAVSFFASFWFIDTAANVQSISLDNHKTQEKLVIQGNDLHPKILVTISRYPMGPTEEWIEENAKSIYRQQERKIEVDVNIYLNISPVH
jgi:hypothetical protein